MVAVLQGTVSSTANPVLLFISVAQEMESEPRVPPGLIVEAAALSYRTLDPSGMEVVPLTVVDIVTEAIRPGTYAPTITVDVAAALGEWVIEWTWDYEVSTTLTLTYTQNTNYTVVDSSIPLVDGYAQVADARTEGVPSTYTNAQVVAALERASRRVEAYTRRFFAPRYEDLDYDAEGNGLMIRTRMPIIAVEDVAINFSDFRPNVRLIEADDYRIYNRHMRGMLAPDDRQSPKIEVLRVDDYYGGGTTFDLFERRFTNAQQNVTITGWWGYTDPDGGPFGKTPLDIQRVTLMLAMGDIPTLWSQFSAGTSGQAAGPIIEQETRDQRVRYAAGAVGGSALSIGRLTGIAAADIILMRFRAPPEMRAV